MESVIAELLWMRRGMAPAANQSIDCATRERSGRRVSAAAGSIGASFFAPSRKVSHAAGAASLGAPASARVMADNEWRQGTTLGLTIGWDLTPRWGIDGRGLWIPSRYGDAFAATIGGRLALQPARPFVPFVSAGAGFHRASFDRATGPAAGFYRDRMMVREGWSHGYAFTDFALALGGGADIFVSRHIALRPDVSAMMVTSRSELTVDQACRLLQLDKATCLLLLDQLIAEGALSQRDDGMYCSIPSVRRRPVRADLSSVPPATTRRRA